MYTFFLVSETKLMYQLMLSTRKEDYWSDREGRFLLQGTFEKQYMYILVYLGLVKIYNTSSSIDIHCKYENMNI